MVLHIPKQVGQEDEKCDETADPEPLGAKESAFRSRQQTSHNSEAKDQHGVLVLEPDSRQQAEPKPELRVTGLTMRMTTQAQPIQNKGSNAFIEREVVERQKARRGQGAEGRQALGKALPPNSRAIRPVSSTRPAPARAGKKRMAARESPSSRHTMLATRAMSGGWST